MQRGIENYDGKDICILGGGDGALLYELLKEKPKFVTMLEIDEMVMDACNKYMKSICGDVLEVRKSENFEVIRLKHSIVCHLKYMVFTSSDHCGRLHGLLGQVRKGRQEIRLRIRRFD